MKILSQVIINAGLSDVWKVISNIQIAHEIIAGIDKIEVTHQPETGIIGLRWMETRMYFGKPASIEK